MANDTKKTVFYVILFSAIAVGGYFAYSSIKKGLAAKNGLSKSDKVGVILTQSGGAGDYPFLMGLGNDYIDAWYDAVVAKQATFKVGANKFDTITGKGTA